MLILLFGITAVDVTVCILFYYIALKNREEMRFSIMKMQYEEQKKRYLKSLEQYLARKDYSEGKGLHLY